MSEHKFDRELPNESAVLNYFADAIDYRNSHKDTSASIAMRVFDRTHPSQLSFSLSKEVERLRYEFGALEAPGSPEDNMISLEDYEDKLWLRLLDLVQKGKEKTPQS